MDLDRLRKARELAESKITAALREFTGEYGDFIADLNIKTEHIHMEEKSFYSIVSEIELTIKI